MYAKRSTSYLEPNTNLTEGMENIFHLNGNQKKITILVPYKIDFKIKTVARDKEGHCIIIKGSIQEDITIVNIYVSNIGAPQYARQKLTAMKGGINSNTIIVEDFSTSLS